MSSEERRAIVMAGLQRRKVDRANREQEEKLDSYEQDMIQAISAKSAQAKKDEQKQQNREKLRAMATARRQEQDRKDAAAEEAIKRYACICVAIMMLADWTPIPWYGAAALIGGLATITAARIYRIYYPN